MAMIAIVYKIYPKEGELETAMKNLKTLNPAGMQTEEIGFGIKLIKALFKFDDSQRSTSKLEDEIKALGGVAEVEVQEESLI